MAKTMDTATVVASLALAAAAAAAAAVFATARRAAALRVVAARVGPGEELKSALLGLAKREGLQAGFVLSCVGSCDGAKVRMAAATAETAAQEVRELRGKHEIVGLVGTVGADGTCHLHVTLADEQGRVVGGHLVGDMRVFTTAEVVLGDCAALRWNRTMDARTGFKELKVAARQSC